MKKKGNTFFSLYTSIHGRLLSYIMMMVHNQTVAEDLLQETAAIMWEKFDQFEEGTNFGAWAISIARHKSLEYLRNNQKSKKLFKEEFYKRLSHVAENSSLDFSNRINALDSCIKKLSKKDRQIIMLRFKNDIKIKELSVRIGKPISSLYLHISNILGLLRICITKSLRNMEA